jgi:pimeloyl-ACP methyl ester carboxylesterase
MWQEIDEKEQAMTTTATANRIRIGSVEFYCETRGSGSGLLLVPGAGGDSGQYDSLAAALATTHRVVTYDRRSCSRSTRPAQWATTSVEEQADDAAGLIAALGVGPMDVFGNSTGALIALCLAQRAPSAVSRLVVHEPALMSVLEDPDLAMAIVQPVIAEGMEHGGMEGGAEAFLRFAGGPAYDRIPTDAIARILNNAEVLFVAEFGAFASWAPDPAALSTSPVAISVLSSGRTAPFFVEAAQWVARHVGATVATAPGGHMGFLEDPQTFADLVRRSLDSELAS